MALLISCRPELISSNIAVDMMDNAKGVAHMPTPQQQQQKKTAIQNQAKITHTTSRRGILYYKPARRAGRLAKRETTPI
jgi:hypothetical protein